RFYRSSVENINSIVDHVRGIIGRYVGTPLGPAAGLLKSAWEVSRTRYRPESRAFRSDPPPPTAEEERAWRVWMTELFMPLDFRIVDLITRQCVASSVGLEPRRTEW